METIKLIISGIFSTIKLCIGGAVIIAIIAFLAAAVIVTFPAWTPVLIISTRNEHEKEMYLIEIGQERPKKKSFLSSMLDLIPKNDERTDNDKQK